MKENNHNNVIIPLMLVAALLIVSCQTKPNSQAAPTETPTPKPMATFISAIENPQIQKIAESLPDVYSQPHLNLNIQGCAYFALRDNQDKTLFSFGDPNLLLTQENKYQTADITPTVALKDNSAIFKGTGVSHYKDNVGEAWGQQSFEFQVPKNITETTYANMSCLSGQVITDTLKPKDPIQMPMNINIQNCAELTITDDEHVQALSYKSPTGLNNSHQEIIIPIKQTNTTSANFQISGINHYKDKYGYALGRPRFTLEYEITNPPRTKSITIDCHNGTITP